MSRLGDLLTERCPSGVTHQALGELGTIFGGLTGKSKADFSEGNARYVSYVNVYKNAAADLSAADYVRVGSAERQRRLEQGDVLFTGASETPADVATSSVITAPVSEPLYLNSFCIGFRFSDPTQFDPEFTKYLFRAKSLRRQLVRTASGVTRYNVSKVRLARVRVPVPPLEVQREIARVLDALGGARASLAHELISELNARRRQYAYYRDWLIGLPDDDAVAWSPMGEVGEFIRGRRFTKKDVVDAGGIPSIHYGEIYTYYGTAATTARSHVREELRDQLRFAQPGDVVIAAVGETVEDVGKAVAWLGDEPVAVHDDCFVFRHSLNPKFVSYCLQTKSLHSQMAPYVARAKVKRLSGESLAKLTIPVVSSAEQDRLVGVLDAYEQVLADMSVSLPAERALRSQQYEHYRDRLLSFSEVPS